MRNFIVEIIKSFCTVFTLFAILYFLDNNHNSWISFVLFPSLALVVALSTLHLSFMLFLGVKDNFSVHQIDILEVDVDLDKLSQMIQSDTHWTLKTQSSNELLYKTNFNWKCWGETVHIKKIGYVTIIESKPVVFTTLVDYGKNYQNVQLVKSHFQKSEILA